MRILIIAVAAAGAFATPALAHPDHDEQFRAPRAAQVDIPQAARQAVARLVSRKRLPASWGSVRPIASSERTRNGARQWVVTFQNDAIRNAAQRRLYVIMRPDGTFVSANHRLT